MNENNPKNLNNSEIAYETEQQTNMEEKENTIPHILKLLNDATPEKYEQIIEMIEKQKLEKNFQPKSLLNEEAKEVISEGSEMNYSKNVRRFIRTWIMVF